MALLYGDLWPALGGTLERGWRRDGERGVMPIEDWKRSVGLVSPELQAAYAATGCTVEEILVSGLHSSIGLDAAANRTRDRRLVHALAAATGISTALAQRRARELSYGQLRLVLIARAFLAPRRLYLLDEPFDGLDAHAQQLMRSRLDAVRRSGGDGVHRDASCGGRAAVGHEPVCACGPVRAPIIEPASGYKGSAAS